MKKALQSDPLRARRSVSDRAVVAGGCETRSGGPSHQLAQLGILDRRGGLGGLRELLRRSAPGRAAGACAASSGSGSGSRPGVNRSAAGASSPSASRSRPRISAACAPSSNAHADERDVRRAASRRGRSAPARRCARSPRRPRRASAASTSAIPAAGPKRESSRRTSSPIRSLTRRAPPRGDLEELGRLDRERRRRRSRSRASARVAASRSPRMRRRRRVELGEHVVEQEERRLAAAARRSASASASRSASTASRCSPCEPKLRRSRAAGDDRDVVEVRPEPGRAALDVPVEPRLERRGGRRLARVDEPRRPGRPELAGALREGRARAARAPRVRASTSAAPSSATCSVHGASASRRREPERRRVAGAALRCATRGAVLERQRGRAPAARRPSVRSKYARRTAGPPLTTARRSGVKTSVGTSRAERLGRAQPARRSPRRASPPPATAPTSSSELRRRRGGRSATTRAAGAPNRISCDVGARARREPLRADVQRLEQVRLAGAVRARHEHEARFEGEVERRVGAKVAERDPGDDQPARRIGMIRYLKSSPAAWSRPGRSGLISFSVISSSTHRLEPVAEELRVEADLERLAGVRRPAALARLADVLRPRRHGQLALGEAEPERRVPLRDHGRRGGRRRAARPRGSVSSCSNGSGSSWW